MSATHALFGVMRETGELVTIGSGRYDTNSIYLHFKSLPYVGVTLRPYIFFAPKALTAHPTIAPEEIAGLPELKVWANPVGTRKDHRPLVWVGWPLVRGAKGLAILKPAVQCPGLEAYEPKQDGFFASLRRGDIDGQGRAEVPLRRPSGADGRSDRVPGVRRGLCLAPVSGDTSAEGAPSVKKRRARATDSA